MKSLRHLSTILALLFFHTMFCQNETEDSIAKIESVLNNYFDLEREAIHLHTDKTSFLNSETIWYQGYIINRKTNKPYFTTNVFILLFDEKGTQLSEKLVYATNGVFSGKIELNPQMKSGKYYIQVFTNWMNNFTENESTITAINIIDPSEGIKNYKKINPESLAVFLHPEGKSLVSDISNIVGIQVKDCRGNTPEDLDVTIQKSNGEVVKTIKLNRFGYGRFDIIPTDENLKIVVKYGEKTIEKNLQKADFIGLSIEVNTFSIQNKTAIRIKTNKQSFDAFQSKKLNLIIHQDQKISSYAFQFKTDALEQTIIVNNENLPAGINTIRIIDNDLKQWSERLIYINPLPQNSFSILKNYRTDDRINLIGYSNSPNLIMSVSILPENTQSLDENNSIVSGVMINPYLIQPLKNSNYYTNAPSRLKLYELDLALLNEEESKYKWDYMKTNVPTSNYTFDVGLSLKGKIDAAIKDKTYHKVKMIAYKDRIMMSADVSETGDYEFQHLLLTDSSLVKLSLEKLPNFTNVASNLYPKVLNRKRSFNKPIMNYIEQNCTDLVAYEAISAFELPKFNGSIIKLDEVVVKKKTLELSRAKMLSNSMLKGYKIDETNNRGSLLNFIEMNGFKVTRNLGDVYISSRLRTSVNAASPTPLIYIDDRVLFSSFNELDIMQMTEIDEIYIDSHKIGASMNNNVGIIKIYTKKPQNNLFSKPDPNSFFVKEAYSLNYPFKNSDYQNTQTKGFDNFGILGWSAFIKANENGDFMFDVIDYNKPRCKIILEGMTVEGEVYHQEKIIDLK